MQSVVLRSSGWVLYASEGAPNVANWVQIQLKTFLWIRNHLWSNKTKHSYSLVLSMYHSLHMTSVPSKHGCTDSVFPNSSNLITCQHTIKEGERGGGGETINLMQWKERNIHYAIWHFKIPLKTITSVKLSLNYIQFVSVSPLFFNFCLSCIVQTLGSHMLNTQRNSLEPTATKYAMYKYWTCYNMPTGLSNFFFNFLMMNTMVKDIRSWGLCYLVLSACA